MEINIEGIGYELDIDVARKHGALSETKTLFALTQREIAVITRLLGLLHSGSVGENGETAKKLFDLFETKNTSYIEVHIEGGNPIKILN